MAAKSPIFPDPNSDFLRLLVKAFHKRSKAIKYHMSEWTIEFEPSAENSENERVSLDFDHFGYLICLSAWGDGALWFRCCKGGKRGWDLNYAFDAWGTSDQVAEIVAAFEATLPYLDNVSDAMAVWLEFSPRVDQSISR